VLRTHTCGELTTKTVGKTVTLTGWVNTRRDHGGLIFIDLRDYYGVTQLRVDPKSSETAWKVADGVRSEYVLQVTGEVTARPNNMVNPKLATGEVELDVQELVVLSKAKTPPFEIDKDGEVNEEIRFKHRYLDLRRRQTRDILAFRGSFIASLRRELIDRGFLEVETPILGKSTPEGARDYLVPSRVHPGEFYALPQSPQQYKQMLMVGGIDKYFQIAPCFRDEDGRADRAPDQFYQLDMEMAFVEQADILQTVEEVFTKTIKTLLPTKKFLTTPWPRLTYAEVMDKYGTDRPDLRYGMELVDVTTVVQQSDFEAMKKGTLVKGLTVSGFAKDASRSSMDALVESAKKLGAKGLAWAKVVDGKLDSQIAKFFPDGVQAELIKAMGAKNGDVVLFVADEPAVVHAVLGTLRVQLANELKLADPNLLAFAYVVDFPLFEPKLEDGHYAPSHHMFTRPKEEDLDKLESDPFSVRSWQHDLILNGFEVGGGSLRIYDPALQLTIFKMVGLDPEKAVLDFSHMLTAFGYGAPPHGGIAPGIDRLVMTLLGLDSVRETMAFPKTGDNRDLMMGAPSPVDPKQLKDLHIQTGKKK